MFGRNRRAIGTKESNTSLEQSVNWGVCVAVAITIGSCISLDSDLVKSFDQSGVTFSRRIREFQVSRILTKTRGQNGFPIEYVELDRFCIETKRARARFTFSSGMDEVNTKKCLPNFKYVENDSLAKLSEAEKLQLIHGSDASSNDHAKQLVIENLVIEDNAQYILCGIASIDGWFFIDSIANGRRAILYFDGGPY